MLKARRRLTHDHTFARPSFAGHHHHQINQENIAADQRKVVSLPPSMWSRQGVVARQIKELQAAGLTFGLGSLDQIANVRFGSKADIGKRAADVRFTPKSGHWLSGMRCPLCANMRHHLESTRNVKLPSVL
jgi:hypothetical protein